jgi:hypothetical protein
LGAYTTAAITPVRRFCGYQQPRDALSGPAKHHPAQKHYSKKMVNLGSLHHGCSGRASR